MVNVRLCFIKMGSWLNYIIFVGCLYAINTDALPALFLDGSPHLQGLLKLLGMGWRKMTLDNLEYSFDRATKVLCISNEEVQKIKQRYTLIENQTDEEKWVDALTEIAEDHRAVVSTLLRVGISKLPTKEIEYKGAIKCLNTVEGGKSPQVVAAIEAGEKETSINKGAKDYSEAFRGICKAWFSEIQALDLSVLGKLNMKPPRTLLELPSIFQAFQRLINDYEGKITDCRDIIVAKDALSDLRRRLGAIEIMSQLLFYTHEDVMSITSKVVALEDEYKMEFHHLSFHELVVIKTEKLENLPKKLKELKDTKPPARNQHSSEEKELPVAEILKLLEKTQGNQEPFIELLKRLYKHYAYCRFMLLTSRESTQIDFILKVIKEENSSQNKFCASWMLGYHMTSFMINQPKVFLDPGVTEEEKIQALKKYGKEMGFPGFYNFVQIIYNLPEDPPTKAEQIAKTFINNYNKKD